MICTALLSADDGETFSLLRLTGKDVIDKDGVLDGVATIAAFEQADETTGGTDVLGIYLDGYIRKAILDNAERFGSDTELMRALLIAGGDITAKVVQRDSRGLISHVIERTV